MGAYLDVLISFVAEALGASFLFFMIIYFSEKEIDGVALSKRHLTLGIFIVATIVGVIRMMCALFFGGHGFVHLEYKGLIGMLFSLFLPITLSFIVCRVLKKNKSPNIDSIQKKQKSEPKVGVGGFTALMFCAGEGDLTSCEKLIEAGSNVNERDDKGATALIYAVLNSNGTIVKLLLKSGADSSIATKRGLTPLSIAKNKKLDLLVDILEQA